MSSIKRIIKLNRSRQRAMREKDFRKFYTFSCKIHLIERMDKVPIGSYILAINSAIGYQLSFHAQSPPGIQCCIV